MMTEKRFIMVKCIYNQWCIVDKTLKDDQIILLAKSKPYVKYIVDLLNELHEENQDLLRYKYLVKALEELVGKYVEELISDWTNGELSDENDILRLGKWHSEKGLTWEEL